MDMPFTTDQFFDVFEAYNSAIWPGPLLSYIVGMAAIMLALSYSRIRSGIVSGILALIWIWIGSAYHLVFFSRINPAAQIFGVLFIIQGFIFVLSGCIRSKLGFRFPPRLIPFIGSIFILYAMVIYPVIGAVSGHPCARAPLFGVAPCPTTIFTFGLLLWSSRPVPLHVVIIPFLWSLVGMAAAVALHVPQDYGLGVSGVLGIFLLMRRNRKLKRQKC